MARYAMQHKVTTPKKLEGFDLEGYAFAPAASSPTALFSAAGPTMSTTVAMTSNHPRIAPMDRRPGPGRATAPNRCCKSMKTSGWNEDVAIDAMETTLRGHLNEQAVAQRPAAVVKVPEPDIDDSPLYLDAGDRRVACCR
jgi:hypothetical protein